jgi:hypothetical protein
MKATTSPAVSNLFERKRLIVMMIRDRQQSESPKMRSGFLFGEWLVPANRFHKYPSQDREKYIGQTHAHIEKVDSQLIRCDLFL